MQLSFACCRLSVRCSRSRRTRTDVRIASVFRRADAPDGR